MTGRSKKMMVGILSITAMASLLSGCQGRTGRNLNQIHTLVSGETKGITGLWEIEVWPLDTFRAAKDAAQTPEAHSGREIRLSSEEISLNTGEAAQVQAVIVPDDAEKESLILWSSNDEGVAVVSPEGEIRAVAKGECMITASLKRDGRIKAELRVQVISLEENKASAQGTGNTNSSIHENLNGGIGESSGDGNPNGSPEPAGDSNSGALDSETGEAEPMIPAYYMDAYAEQVLELVNARRAEAGLEPLSMNAALVSVARVRAAEIVQGVSHTRPNDTSCFTAWEEGGVGYSGAGENLAAGQWSAESAMNAWMNSEGHRANILNGSFTQIGIACYYAPDSPYGYYWVQCFIY